jgi:hypothetical protein
MAISVWPGLIVGQDGEEGLLLDPDGLLDEGELGVVFLLAEPGDEAGGAAELALADDGLEGVELGEGHGLGLDGAGFDASDREDVGGGLDEALLADVEVGEGLDLFELFLVAEVGDDDGFGAGGAEEEVAVAAEEAGEVGDIGGVGNKEGIGAGGGERFLEAGQTGGEGRAGGVLGSGFGGCRGHWGRDDIAEGGVGCDS